MADRSHWVPESSLPLFRTGVRRTLSSRAGDLSRQCDAHRETRTRKSSNCQIAGRPNETSMLTLKAPPSGAWDSSRSRCWFGSSWTSIRHGRFCF